MDFCKILIAAIFVVTLSSVTHAAPVNSSPGRVELLIKLGLVPKLTNATKEVGIARFSNDILGRFLVNN